MKKLCSISGALALIAACALSAGCQKMDEGGRRAPLMRFRVSAAETRSATNTTAGLNTDGQSLSIIAVADAARYDNTTQSTTPAGKYFDAVLKCDDDGKWDTYDSTTGDAVQLYWLNDVGIHMWCYYPVSLGTATGSAVRTITDPAAASDVLSFTYQQPAASAGSDATNQKDILFAGNKENREFNDAGEITTSGEDETVSIKFYHALSEIRFAVSPDDGSFDPSLKVTSIKISDVYGKAKCKFTVPSTSPTTLFAWSDHSSLTDYSQTTGLSFASTPTGWTSSTFNTNKKLYTMDNRFFMIPQTLGDFAEITVTFEYLDSDGVYQSVDRTFSIAGNVWKAGYYYTYKISASSVGQDIAFSISLVEWEDENLAVLV